MMLFRNEYKVGAEKPTSEQMEMIMKPWKEWISGIAAQGKYTGTNRLMTEGKTIKANNFITDGPFVEAKEMIGGYLIVKAKSLDEAVEIAKGCPIFLYGGTVEVRSVLPIEYDLTSGNFLNEIK